MYKTINPQKAYDMEHEEKSLEAFYSGEIDPIIAKFISQGHNPTDSHYNQLKEMIKKGLNISNVKFTDLKK
jgi:hypothetical protein